MLFQSWLFIVLLCSYSPVWILVPGFFSSLKALLFRRPKAIKKKLQELPLIGQKHSPKISDKWSEPSGTVSIGLGQLELASKELACLSQGASCSNCGSDLVPWCKVLNLWSSHKKPSVWTCSEVLKKKEQLCAVSLSKRNKAGFSVYSSHGPDNIS